MKPGFRTADSGAVDPSAQAINPANYRFRLKGVSGPACILELTPRSRKPGLFKGELWLDAETGMPLRESGQFVKNPSVFIKRIRFVREYEIRDGVAVPKRINSTVETRFVGRAELSVEFNKEKSE